MLLNFQDCLKSNYTKSCSTNKDFVMNIVYMDTSRPSFTHHSICWFVCVILRLRGSVVDITRVNMGTFMASEVNHFLRCQYLQALGQMFFDSTSF